MITRHLCAVTVEVTGIRVVAADGSTFGGFGDQEGSLTTGSLVLDLHRHGGASSLGETGEYMGLFDFLKPAPPRPAAPPAIELERRQTFGYRIAGCTNYQRAISRFNDRGEHYAIIEREPSNAYDENAIRVSLGGQTVGYFKADEAAYFVEWMEKQGLAPDTRFKGLATVVHADSPIDGHDHLYVNLAIKMSPPRVVT